MSDSMAKFMPKVFRAEGDATERLPRASPELMKLCNTGHLRVWANMECQQPEKIQFLPEGLYARNEDLTYEGTDAPFRSNRYKKTKLLDNGNVVEQRKFVLEIPGYDPVDKRPCPDNNDVQIYEKHPFNILEVSLTRQIQTLDEWSEDGVNQHIYPVERKLQQFQFDINWATTEIEHENGFLTVVISGKERKLRRPRRPR
jgi:hypothetical protein